MKELLVRLKVREVILVDFLWSVLLNIVVYSIAYMFTYHSPAQKYRNIEFHFTI